MTDFLFYLQLGWEHIISSDALDHQLFILALVAIFSFKDLKSSHSGYRFYDWAFRNTCT